MRLTRLFAVGILTCCTLPVSAAIRGGFFLIRQNAAHSPPSFLLSAPNYTPQELIYLDPLIHFKLQNAEVVVAFNYMGDVLWPQFMVMASDPESPRLLRNQIQTETWEKLLVFRPEPDYWAAQTLPMAFLTLMLATIQPVERSFLPASADSFYEQAIVKGKAMAKIQSLRQHLKNYAREHNKVFFRLDAGLPVAILNPLALRVQGRHIDEMATFLAAGNLGQFANVTEFITSPKVPVECRSLLRQAHLLASSNLAAQRMRLKAFARDKRTFMMINPEPNLSSLEALKEVAEAFAPHLISVSPILDLQMESLIEDPQLCLRIFGSSI